MARRSRHDAPTRPPEVPADKWRGYSPSYRHRLAAFYEKHPGAPLHEARGKRASEHITRRDRENEKIRIFAERQAYRGYTSGARPAAEIQASLQRMRKERGMRAVSALIAENHRLHAARASGAMVKGSYDLEDLAEEYDMPESELFYG